MALSLKTLSRRSLLRASGASVLTLPLLNAFQANAQSTPAPKRFVFLYNPNGTIAESFWPVTAASDAAVAPTETDFALNRIMEPLAPFQDQLLLLRGLNLSVTQVGPGGPHQRGMGALLTGSELQEGTFREDDGSLAGWSNGRSIDQEIGSTIGATTLLSSLELGVRTGEAEVRTRIIYGGPAQPVPLQDDPRAAFARLSVGFSSGGNSMSAVERELERSVLDTVTRQYAELTPVLGIEDRALLDRHATFIREIERRLDVVVSNADGCTLVEPPALNVDSEEDMPEVSRLHMDLIAAAFACDLTRVATLQFSSAVNPLRFPWLNSLGHGHNLSHAGPSNTQATEELVVRSQWYASQFSDLLRALSLIPEGEGTVLDNAAVLWSNEISVGNTHDLTHIPFVMAGSAGGYFNTGRLLTYEAVSHNCLLVSLLNAAGIDTMGWGHPDYHLGPLAGLTV